MNSILFLYTIFYTNSILLNQEKIVSFDKLPSNIQCIAIERATSVSIYFFKSLNAYQYSTNNLEDQYGEIVKPGFKSKRLSPLL